MATSVFACHEAGVGHGKTCAGFLLRGADHNLSARLGHMTGRYAGDVRECGAILFDSYGDMAVASGVCPEDPVLKACR